MRGYKLVGYLATIVLCLFAAHAQSQPTTQARPAPQAEIAVQKFYERAGRDWIIRWSSDGARVLSLVGREAAPGKAKGFERVREFLRQNAPLFGLEPNLGDLKLISEHTSAAGHHIELQQMYQDLPVENGRLNINLDKEGRVLHVKSSYLPEIRVEKLEPIISETDATERAIAQLLKESAKKLL